MCCFGIEDMDEKEMSKHQDIDGCYARIILFSSFMCIGIATGFRQIFGIYIHRNPRYLSDWEILEVLDYHVTGVLLGSEWLEYGISASLKRYVTEHKIFTPHFKKSYMKCSSIRVFS